MLVYFLFGLVATTAAAPTRRSQTLYEHSDYSDIDSLFDSDAFKDSLTDQIRRDLHKYLFNDIDINEPLEVVATTAAAPTRRSQTFYEHHDLSDYSDKDSLFDSDAFRDSLTDQIRRYLHKYPFNDIDINEPQVATTAAAPTRRSHQTLFKHHDLSDYSDKDSLFDTDTSSDSLFGKFTRDLLNPKRIFGEMHEHHFPASSIPDGVEGNEFIMKYFLPDYDEKEIVVEVLNRVLLVQAVHQPQDMIEKRRRYYITRYLPYDININGTWIYEDEILKISFPLIRNDEEPMTTLGLDLSREEMGPNEGKVVENYENVDIILGKTIRMRIY